MFRKQSLLDNVRIASPCHALWSEMEGDDKMRYCKLCKLNVYDVSNMTKPEAEKLIRDTNATACLRLHYRSDGRIITRDCPVGFAAVKRRIRYAVAIASAIALAGWAKASTFWISGESPADSSFGQLYAQAKDKIIPPPPPRTVTTAPVGKMMVAGRMAITVPISKAPRFWFSASGKPAPAKAAGKHKHKRHRTKH
jgi:hypothetical protein